MIAKRALIATVSVLIAAAAVARNCGRSADDRELVSSHAYRGHENDLDMNRFVNAYKNTLGTRLDDCQTCHTGGTFTYPSEGKTKSTAKNACDFCHLIQHPDATLTGTQPSSFAATLNAYGKSYLEAGRNAPALSAIARSDSDGDGAANEDEVRDLKYPGDPASKPGQQLAPMRRFTLADLQALPAHEELVLANASKQQFDSYASFRGVRIRDLLAAAGLDPTDPGITGVTVIAPDGYLKDIPASRINAAYPVGLYYAGLDTATLGPTCGFVQYPSILPAALTDGGTIAGEPWLMLAYARDGAPMEVSSLDATSGKINGEGPLRIVVPQSKPGRPDRGSQYSPTQCGDGLDYDPGKDHNAGDMVRGVVAIRVNPLPAGLEDFDYRYGGWAFIDSESVLVYGYGITSGN